MDCVSDMEPSMRPWYRYEDDAEPRDVKWFVRRAEEYRRRREEPLDAAYRDEAAAWGRQEVRDE